MHNDDCKERYPDCPCNTCLLDGAASDGFSVICCQYKRCSDSVCSQYVNESTMATKL